MSNRVCQLPCRASNCVCSCRAIYQRLFSWVASRINEKISVGKCEVKAVIGVLDIYGFEIFKTNSFEQVSWTCSILFDGNWFTQSASRAGCNCDLGCPVSNIMLTRSDLFVV